MKKIAVIFLFVVIIFCLLACSSGEEAASYELSPFQDEQFTENVELKIISADENEINIQFNNLSDILYIYGIIPFIEIYYNDEWRVVPTAENITWTCEGYYIEPKSSCEDRIPIGFAYNLCEGDYRLILGITDDSKIPTTEQDYIVAEFSVK